mgnify:FL=1
MNSQTKVNNTIVFLESEGFVFYENGTDYGICKKTYSNKHFPRLNMENIIVAFDLNIQNKMYVQPEINKGELMSTIFGFNYKEGSIEEFFKFVDILINFNILREVYHVITGHYCVSTIIIMDQGCIAGDKKVEISIDTNNLDNSYFRFPGNIMDDKFSLYDISEFANLCDRMGYI